MPGHVKLGKKGEPDPDPSEYLIVSMDMKREDQMKPYDSKKSYWVPDGQGGYLESILESDDGKQAKVIVKGYEVNIYVVTLYINFISDLENFIKLVKYGKLCVSSFGMLYDIWS